MSIQGCEENLIQGTCISSKTFAFCDVDLEKKKKTLTYLNAKLEFIRSLLLGSFFCEIRHWNWVLLSRGGVIFVFLFCCHFASCPQLTSAKLGNSVTSFQSWLQEKCNLQIWKAMNLLESFVLAMCVLHVIQFLLTFLQPLRYGAHRSINIFLWIKIKECKTVLMSFQKRKEATRNALQIYFSLLFFFVWFIFYLTVWLS